MIWPNTGSIVALPQRVEGAAAIAGELFAHSLIEPVLPPGTLPVSRRAVGRDEHLDPAVCDRLDLPGVPVAGVTDDRFGLLGDPVLAQVSERGVEHRFQMPEVGSFDADLGREDDLLLG